MFYLLEGECEVQCGDRTFEVSKGSLAILPRKIPHGFRNIVAFSSTILVTIPPDGFERFFEEVSQLPADKGPEMERVMVIARNMSLSCCRNRMGVRDITKISIQPMAKKPVVADTGVVRRQNGGKLHEQRARP